MGRDGYAAAPVDLRDGLGWSVIDNASAADKAMASLLAHQLQDGYCQVRDLTIIGGASAITQGTPVPLTWRFERGGEVTISMPVAGPGATINRVHSWGAPCQGKGVADHQRHALARPGRNGRGR
ncbi:periplasmic copper chaperone A [uncultured Gammaproteobacteria bacterium]